MKQNNTIPIKIEKSWKHMTPRYTTTFNTGDIVPFFNRIINPNDYIKLSAESITNMSIPNYATMDLLFQDVTFFESPLKLVFNDWDKFFGEDKNNPYIQDVQIFLPQLSCPSGGWAIGTVADYLNLPTGVNCKSVCALPFRIFALIVDNYYRDEQREQHYLVSKGATDQTGTNGNSYYTDLQNGGKVPKACKLYDYFTGTKLEFQAGDPVKIPFATEAPVVGTGKVLGLEGDYAMAAKLGSTSNQVGIAAAFNGMNANADTSGTSATFLTQRALGVSTDAAKSGLIADLSNANALDLRSFKIALMTQQYLQNLEDGGTRYIEQIYKRWGIYAKELELQVPQYLGGHRFPLNMEMIASTNQAAGTGVSSFGAITGVSNTRFKGFYFKKHFKQHGWLFGITTIRPLNTYQQGIDKQMILASVDDFYKPEMAHLGPDIVHNYEIYSDSSDNKDDDMFGVRNYGDYLRYMPNKVSGQIRKNSPFSQDYKTYANWFNSRPVNNTAFIKADEAQVDKTLINVQNAQNVKMHQFTFQIQLDIWIRQNLPRNGNGSTILRI